VGWRTSHSYLLLGRLRGGFHLCRGSYSGDHFADSPSDEFGVIKVDPMSAVARHEMPPTRRELR